ncbi:MAG: PIG-L family deacetylase [Acidimicrobiia bacterium]|nr:PIG-L family deacetylase [Acidimicrobiia bacterium]
MLGLEFDREPRTVLCLGAHPDDIEIGAGGTLLKLADRAPQAKFHWVVFTSTPERTAEATQSAKDLLGDRVELIVGQFEDGLLPYRTPAKAKEFLRAAVADKEIDLAFTHHREDRHQDHRFVADITGQVLRDHMTLQYEILKRDGDVMQPNVFVRLSEKIASTKLDHLLDHFPSQNDKAWFDRETLAALMRIRAVECGAPSGFAEAFSSRTTVLM